MAGRTIFTLDQAVDAIDGAIPDGGFGGDVINVQHVAVDSRASRAGSLFVALPGEHTDGHRFVVDAAQRGAVAAVVSRAIEDPGIPTIRVEDSLSALQALAAWYARERLADVFRVGITGSNGKTTTKELVAAAIRSSAECFASEGNLNSETGLPLSIFATPPEVSYAVYEMAMSAPGEMEALAEIVRPRIACITNIGSAHIEFLGSRRAIALEKRGIASCFTGSETLIIPEDDEFTGLLAEGVAGTVRYHGPGVLGLSIDASRERGAVWIEDDGYPAVRVPLPGYHNGRNALVALAVARELGFDEGRARAALAEVSLPEGRSDLYVDQADNVVLNDSYNANPESMEAFIRSAGALRNDVRQRLVLVLGDMMELGDYSAEGHRRVLGAACGAAPDLLVLVGRLFADVYRDHFAALCAGVPVERVSSAEEARDRLLQLDLRGHVIALKGSRTIALEEVLSLFERREVAHRV